MARRWQSGPSRSRQRGSASAESARERLPASTPLRGGGESVTAGPRPFAEAARDLVLSQRQAATSESVADAIARQFQAVNPKLTQPRTGNPQFTTPETNALANALGRAGIEASKTPGEGGLAPYSEGLSKAFNTADDEVKANIFAFLANGPRTGLFTNDLLSLVFAPNKSRRKAKAAEKALSPESQQALQEARNQQALLAEMRRTKTARSNVGPEGSVSVDPSQEQFNDRFIGSAQERRAEQIIQQAIRRNPQIADLLVSDAADAPAPDSPAMGIYGNRSAYDTRLSGFLGDAARDRQPRGSFRVEADVSADLRASRVAELMGLLGIPVGLRVPNRGYSVKNPAMNQVRRLIEALSRTAEARRGSSSGTLADPPDAAGIEALREQLSKQLKFSPEEAVSGIVERRGEPDAPVQDYTRQSLGLTSKRDRAADLDLDDLERARVKAEQQRPAATAAAAAAYPLAAAAPQKKPSRIEKLLAQARAKLAELGDIQELPPEPRYRRGRLVDIANQIAGYEKRLNDLERYQSQTSDAKEQRRLQRNAERIKSAIVALQEEKAAIQPGHVRAIAGEKPSGYSDYNVARLKKRLDDMAAAPRNPVAIPEDYVPMQPLAEGLPIQLDDYLIGAVGGKRRQGISEGRSQVSVGSQAITRAVMGQSKAVPQNVRQLAADPRAPEFVRDLVRGAEEGNLGLIDLDQVAPFWRGRFQYVDIDGTPTMGRLSPETLSELLRQMFQYDSEIVLLPAVERSMRAQELAIPGGRPTGKRGGSGQSLAKKYQTDQYHHSGPEQAERFKRAILEGGDAVGRPTPFDRQPFEDYLRSMMPQPEQTSFVPRNRIADYASIG